MNSGFIQMPRDVLAADWPAAVKIVAAVILDECRQSGGRCNWGIRTIARVASVNPKTVCRAIKIMTEEALIARRFGRPGQRATLYRRAIRAAKSVPIGGAEGGAGDFPQRTHSGNGSEEKRTHQGGPSKNDSLDSDNQRKCPKVRDDSLKQAGPLLELHAECCRRGLAVPGERGELEFFAAAERAIARGRKPAALFAAIVNAGLGNSPSSIGEEERARRRLKRWKFGEGARRRVVGDSVGIDMDAVRAAGCC